MSSGSALSRKVTECIDSLQSTFDDLRLRGRISDRDIDGLDRTATDHRIMELLCSWRAICNSDTHTTRLPPEILATIFREVSDTWPRWMIIRQVCRHWRAVADACAALWSTIVLRWWHLGENRHFKPHIEKYVEFFLRNSQHALLDATIIFPGSSSSLDVISAIISHLPRIHRLNVKWTGNSDHRLCLLTDHTSASELKELSLDFSDYHPHTSDAPQSQVSSGFLAVEAPVLQSLYINGCDYPVTCHFRNLKQLLLCDCSFGGCLAGLLDLLRNCGHALEHLMLCTSGHKNLPPVCPVGQRICLPKLKKVAFLAEEDTDVACGEALLPHLDFPPSVFIYSNNLSTATNDLLQRNASLLADLSRVYLNWGIHYRSDNMGAAGDYSALSFANIELSEVDYYIPAVVAIMNTAREFWLDSNHHRCFRRHESAAVLSMACSALKIYCCSETVQCILGLCQPYGTTREHVYCPLLQEIHFLYGTRATSDPEVAADIQEVLKTRQELGFPVGSVYLYLPIAQDDSTRSVLEPEGDRKLEQLVAALQSYTRVELVHTLELPKMKVPDHCTVQSGGLRKWPIWNQFSTSQSMYDYV